MGAGQFQTISFFRWRVELEGSAIRTPRSSYPTKVWMVQGSAATLFVATNNKGLLRTNNEGASWEFTNAGLPTGIGTEDVTPIIGLVSGARSSLSIYVLTETQGVFRSGNNGLTWDGASAGLPVPLFKSHGRIFDC